MSDAQRRAFAKRFDADGDGRLSRAELTKLIEALPEQGRQRLIRQFDADGDGELNQKEKLKAMIAMSRRLSGNANTDRPSAGRPNSDRPNSDRPNSDRPNAGRPNVGRPPNRALLARFDENKNGRLDPEEIAKARAAFSRRNATAKTDRKPTDQPSTRRKTNTPNNAQRANLLKRFDKNKNGRLDPDELAEVRKAFPGRRGSGGALAFGALNESGAEPEGKLDKTKALSEFDKDGDGRLSPTERRAALAAARKRNDK